MDLSKIDITRLTAKDQRDILQNHPDTIKVTIGGKEFDFYFGGASYSYAEGEDIDLVDIMENEDKSGMKKDLEELAQILYIGVLPFDDSIKFEEIVLRLSMNEYQRISREVLPRVFGVDDASVAKVLDEEAGAGQKKPEKEDD